MRAGWPSIPDGFGPGGVAGQTGMPTVTSRCPEGMDAVPRGRAQPRGTLKAYSGWCSPGLPGTTLFRGGASAAYLKAQSPRRYSPPGYGAEAGLVPDVPG